MSRPLRVRDPGMWHHVMNRGLGRMRIFNDDRDREALLDLVAECGARFDVWASAYCLMPNHYHLLVFDEAGGLSRAMRHIDGVFTQRFNRRHERDGPLMRGRFRSRVVQRERFVLEVLRYIHTNPVRARMVSRAGDYAWSSHAALVLGKEHTAVRRAPVMDLVGGDTRANRTHLDALVHDRVDAEMSRLLDVRRWTPVLGDDAFVRAIVRRLRAKGAAETREVPEARRLASLSVEEVLEAACAELGVTRDELVTGRRGQGNIPRLAAIALCRDATAAPAAKIGEVFSIRPSTVSVLAGKAREKSARGRQVASAKRLIAKRLAAKNKQQET